MQRGLPPGPRAPTPASPPPAPKAPPAPAHQDRDTPPAPTLPPKAPTRQDPTRRDPPPPAPAHPSQAATRQGRKARRVLAPQGHPPQDRPPPALTHPNRVPREQGPPASLSLGFFTALAPTSLDRRLSRGRRPPRHPLSPVPSPAGRRPRDLRHPARVLDLSRRARLPADPACPHRQPQDPRPPGRQSSDHRHQVPTLPGLPRQGRPVPASTPPPDHTPSGSLSYPGGLPPDRTHPCRSLPEGSRPGPILSQSPRPPGRPLADVPLPEGQAQDRTASPGPTAPEDPRYPGRPPPAPRAAVHRSAPIAPRRLAASG